MVIKVKETIVMIYHRDSYVSGSMCDCRTQLSLLASDCIVENAVTELMGELGIDGITAIEKHNAMWLMVKNRIHFIRQPAWREEFTIKSFITECSGAKLDIDTVINATDGSGLITAKTEFAVIDLESGKLRKAETVGCSQSMVHPSETTELRFTRFPKTEGIDIDSVTIRSTDIDYCFHTNNVQYVRFVLDTYDTEWHKQRTPADIEIHYTGQSFEGEKLVIEKLSSDSGDLFRIKRDSKELTSCMICWKDTAIGQSFR
jgi:acyl-ACP thioesterase